MSQFGKELRTAYEFHQTAVPECAGSLVMMQLGVLVEIEPFNGSGSRAIPFVSGWPIACQLLRGFTLHLLHHVGVRVYSPP